MLPEKKIGKEIQKVGTVSDSRVPGLNLLKKIAKTGSLCCVAARPHGSNAASGDWSVGPHEPYWRMNTSFSPPPARWDYHFQTEGLRYGSNDSLQLFDSSTSSNSKESRSWVRGMYQHSHQYPPSDGTILDGSSPSDSALIQPWTPPPRQGISTDDLGTTTKRETMSGPLFFTPTMEGASITRDARGSTSSRSDGSDFDHTIKLRLSTQRSCPSRRSFMSKPVHPLSFSHQIPSREASENTRVPYLEYENAHHSSSGSSSMDLTDIAEQFDSDNFAQTYVNPTEGFRCGLCDRFLSQRSPWSSRRIVRSKDMPVTGVLSCRHIFHAECLEQSTPKAQKSDPPCPLCSKPEEGQAEHSVLSNKTSIEEAGPSSRPWGCGQGGDCVEGAVRGPHRSSMLFLGRNRMKKNLSLKGNTGREFPGKLRKIGSHPLQFLGGKFVDQGLGSSSKAAAGSNTDTLNPVLAQ
ncbi:hypothetical protein V2J09_019967 [Rumex salicifolius]